MKQGINVIGWYLEEREDGRGHQIVIVPPSEGDPEDGVEHVARTPQELWAAFEEIARNPEMPETHTEGADAEYEDEEHMQAASDDVGGLAVEAAQAFVTNACGPMIGRLAGGIIRNPGGAMDFLRSISRKDRR